MGSGVAVVGLVRGWLVFLAVLALLGLLVAATIYYKRVRWVPVKKGQPYSAALGGGCMMAMISALLLRGYEWSSVLVPLLSLAVSMTVHRWLTRSGHFSDPDEGGSSESGVPL